MLMITDDISVEITTSAEMYCKCGNNLRYLDTSRED